MSIRAVVIGLSLGLLIACCAYFNDAVIGQTPLIGNELPVGVFGLLLVLLLAINPVLRTLRHTLALGPSEWVVVTAMALAVCGWPGSGFFRTFTGTVAMPSLLQSANTDWQTQGVMSFVPGASSEIAPGQVMDWPALLHHLRDFSRTPDDPVGRRIWNELPPHVQQSVLSTPQDHDVDGLLRQSILASVNRQILTVEPNTAGSSAIWRLVDEDQLPADAAKALHERQRILDQAAALEAGLLSSSAPPTEQTSRWLAWYKHQADQLAHRANRAIVTARSDGSIAPAPAGEGVLLAGGSNAPLVVDTLARGWDGSTPLSSSQLPWRAWWPTLRLWGGLALLMGLGSLCLVLVVNPQWSKHELLTYPTVRFVNAITEGCADRRFPAIVYNRSFWGGFIAVAAIHSINGLNAWFPAVPPIPLQLDLWGLYNLIPSMAQVSGSWGMLNPRIFLSVVAFAFFLSGEVSLSLGLSTVVWLIIGGIFISGGVVIDSGQVTSVSNMLHAGAYLGSALMILFVGRHYYLNVLAGVAGLPRRSSVPGYAVWAARIGMLCVVASVYHLNQWAGLDWRIGLLLVICLAVMLLVLTRINVETGAFFVQPAWMPISVLAAVLGMEGMGPTGFFLVAIVGSILVIDPREAVAPFLANGLKMMEQTASVRPARAAPVLAMMVVVGFVAALIVTLTLQYNKGISVADTWARETVPSQAFTLTSQQISELSSKGTLAASVDAGGWNLLSHAQLNTPALKWMAMGAALVIVCALARLRFPWWPIHPVLFLVWGTYPMFSTSFSFLLGCLVKTSVTRFGGAAACRRVLPVMVGIIAGEMIAAISWTVVGALYYQFSGTIPTSYSILPG